MSAQPAPLSTPSCPARRRLAALLSAWSLLSPTGVVWAGPVADATAAASQRPSVVSASGVPLVNIAAPNASGLSYNRYQRFDVDPVGAILNNSRTSGVSAAGVALAGNPNFVGQSAATIVNEVVTALPSQLNGPLAVFGDPAKVVIANPNGITCNGCGFINTTAATLTTGQIRFLDAPGGNATAFATANALAFVVSGGQIIVTGDGLASPLARLDLIAQSLKLEAPTRIGSGALNLIAGRNTVDADTLAILAQGSGNDAATQGPGLAIDAKLLGAMEAGRILMVSTAAGLGVRSVPNLAASSGDLRIAANGDITLARGDAAGNLNLVATGNLAHGGLSALGNAGITAGTLDNHGQTIAAQGDVRVTTPALNNRAGQILAGGSLALATPGASLDLADGTLYGGRGLAVQARDITNSGAFSHAAAVSLNADNTIDNSGSFLVGGDLAMTATSLTNRGTLGSFGTLQATLGSLVNQGTLQAAGALDLVAAILDNQAGATLVGGDGSRLRVSGALSNAGSLGSTGSLDLAAGTLSHAGRTEALGDLALAVTGDAINSGQILARNDLAATFGRLINTGTVAADRDASVQFGPTSDNSGGQILALRDLSLSTGHPGEIGGTVGADRDLTLNLSAYTHNGGTTFLAGRNLTVNAGDFTNHAVLEAWQDLAFNLTGTLTNSGQLLAGRDISLNAGTIVNTGGSVEAARDLALTAGTVINQRPPVTTVHNNWGDYQPPGSVNCRSDHGYCESWQQVESGPAAVLWGGRHLTANVTGTLTNDASLIAAVGDVSLTAAVVANTAHTLTTTWHGHWKEWKGALRGYKDHDDYGISVTGNTAADVSAGGTLAITAPSLANSGNLLAGNVILAGTHLTSGLTDPALGTPATTLPSATVTLGVPGVSGRALPATVQFHPAGGSYFTSASRLALLTPGMSINTFLPGNLQNTATPFLMDAALEQAAIRQAALADTGRASFLAMNDPAGERAWLLEAGARFAAAHGIRLGVGLADDLVAQLESPILWYVTESFTGPDGKSYAALVPKVYLPPASRLALANLAGGTIQGGEVTLSGESVRNTGFIAADGSLTINARSFTNEKRSADIANGGPALRVYDGTRGYWKITGSTVQPGGFVSAAKLDLNVGTIKSVSGEFFENHQDVGTKLAAALGPQFVQSVAKDDLHQEYKRLSKPSALKQVAIMVVSVVVAYFTAGAVSAVIAESASGGTAVAAGEAASWSTAAISAGAGGMASSATTQLLTTGKLDAGQMFKAGLTSGMTAGLTNGLGLDKLDGLSNSATGPMASGAGSADWGVKALAWTARAGVSAGVSTAINGGSFKTAFVNDWVANGAASLASTIGDLKRDGTFNEVGRVAAHGLLGCAAQAASGGQCAGGAIGAMASSIAGNFVSDPQTAFGKALVVGGLSGVGGLAAIAAGKDGVAGFNAAKNEVVNNRLLHPSEQERARQLYALAKTQGLTYTLADIEDALRWANYKGENPGTNTYVNAAKDAALTGPAGDAYGSSAFDPMRPGVDTNSKAGYRAIGMEIGQMTLLQDMSGVAKPSAELASFIQSNTSGYSWGPGNIARTIDPNASKAWTSNGYVPVTTSTGSARYVSVTVNGQVFNVPVADCPAGGCAHGSSIAWASSSPGDQEVLAAYRDALNKEDAKTLTKATIGTGMALLAPPTLGGSIAAGGIIAGGSSAAEQFIDSGKVDAAKTAKDTIVGGVVGAATFGVVKTVGAVDAMLDNVLPSSIKEAVANEAVGAERLVIGRVTDLAEPGALWPGEFKLGWPPTALAQSEWRINSGLLRQEMKNMRPIRDASVGDTRGTYLNAERYLLEDRGWQFSPDTSLWMPPTRLP